MAQGLFNLKQVNQAIQQGAWTTGIKTPSVDYLVVAGGGGGGLAGGGAGGLLSGTRSVVAGSAITVTVGAGGFGADGSNSVFGSILSNGGSDNTTARTGGSGGGAYFNNPSGVGQGIAGQGNAGASGSSAGGSGGGGGGAGTVGMTGAQINQGGQGGQGVALAISGTMTAYAGGGGGYGSSTGGAGGAGGGGTGPTASANGTAGTANTGGGGGGSTGGSPASGGSGIVIISYPDVYAAPTATTGSPTVSTSGSGSLSIGNGNYLFGPSTITLSGNLTVECWVNFSNITTSNLIIFLSDQSTGSYQFGFANGCLYFTTTYPYTVSQATPTYTINTWAHIVAVRSGTTLSIYVNGTRVGTTTSAASFVYAGYPVIGAYASVPGQYYPTGYISNFRMTNTAVYDPTQTSITVPTTPLTPVSGSQLLLNTVSGAQYADGSSNSYKMSITGSPTWNQSSPFSTGLGYKNRVYTWTSSGSITF